MRHALSMVAIAAVVGSLVSLGVAAETAKPESTMAEAVAKAPANAELRVEMHRTLADLIEARSNETPDAAKVAELTAKLEQLRGQLRGQNPPAAGAADGWTCPHGAGMGYGRGRGGPGMGYGRPSGGPGMGFGPGGGRGPGAGPGAGQGKAPGGPAFVDRDKDGVCDHFQQRQATKQ